MLHSLSTYCLPGLVLGSRYTIVKKTDVISAYIPQDYSLVRNRSTQKYSKNIKCYVLCICLQTVIVRQVGCYGIQTNTYIHKIMGT